MLPIPLLTRVHTHLRVAAMTGASPSPDMVAIRGEYLQLKASKRHLVQGNIYPVPSPAVPFLGVHFTPRPDGGLWLGPNAVPAFGRETYSWQELSLSGIIETFKSRAFRSLMLHHFQFGLEELYRSLFVGSQVGIGSSPSCVPPCQWISWFVLPMYLCS
eukprot:m.141304 g.141304  ORF g.141304 m.141304 type:complete len:159 (+) comp14036_c0_seq2:153-629(+)